MSVMLVDPSLYTPPYDAALTRALLAIGVQPTWATRPLRPGERQEIPVQCTDAFFYKRVDGAGGRLRLPLKACAHLAGSAKLVWQVFRRRPDAVHFQWIVMPLIDVVAMSVMRRWCPVVLTLHDTTAHNGDRLSWAQHLGYDLPIRLAHRVIVHTRSGREALARRGVQPGRIAVIPHGPLSLPEDPAPAARERDPRWTAVLFGEIKPYKGLDVLIEAVAALAPELRRRLRVVVAGRPRMDMGPLKARIAALGLSGQFELRLRRLSETEMSGLFAEADAFVFPYRQIDASGVYYLVSSLGKWLIASRVGVFAEEGLDRQGLGALVPPEDVPALARALRHAIERRPAGRRTQRATSWVQIAYATRRVYEGAKSELAARQPAGSWQR